MQKVSFACTQCGKCCAGRGGRVRVNGKEIQAIAQLKDMSEHVFRKEYVRFDTSREVSVLKQTEDDTKCVFLQGKKCTIYEGWFCTIT